MVNNVILLGAYHGDSTTKGFRISDILCGPMTDQFLERNWFSSFDEKHTLLILESVFHKNILSYEHPMYDSYLKTISKALYESEHGPDILCADTRFKNYERSPYMAVEIIELYQWIRENIMYLGGEEAIPKKFIDIQNRFLNSNFKYVIQFSNPPSIKIKRLATRFLKSRIEMESYMLEQASKYSHAYEQILILTGAGHTLAMHRQSKFPHHILHEPQNQEELSLWYINLFLMQEGPEMIINY